jgi:hypothetical protein
LHLPGELGKLHWNGSRSLRFKGHHLHVGVRKHFIVDLDETAADSLDVFLGDGFFETKDGNTSVGELRRTGLGRGRRAEVKEGGGGDGCQVGGGKDGELHGDDERKKWLLVGEWDELVKLFDFVREIWMRKRRKMAECALFRGSVVDLREKLYRTLGMYRWMCTSEHEHSRFYLPVKCTEP